MKKFKRFGVSMENDLGNRIPLILLLGIGNGFVMNLDPLLPGGFLIPVSDPRRRRSQE